MVISEPVIVFDSVNPSKLPISANELTEFINNQKFSSINSLIDLILIKLQEKSSKFKYIINATSILINENANNKISNSFGSSWDEKNDGLLNIKFKLDDSTWLILNIYFISVN